MALVAILKPESPLIGGIWHVGDFAFVSVGGIAVGLATGWAALQVQRHVIDDGPEIMLTVSLLTPFLSYLAGEMTHVSSVLAVVSTGLYLGRNSPEAATPAVRLRSQAVWESIVYLLNGMVFVLIGLQLPGILHNMREHWWPRPYLYAVAVTVFCILLRIAWVFAGAYLPRLLRLSWQRREPAPPWREVFIVSWAGMRGVVSLAAALALNGHPEFPRTHLVQFIAFSVILGTLVFQGLTLPGLIRHLGVGDDGSAVREEGQARRRMVEAALEKIAEMRHEQKYPEPVLEEAEHRYREHALADLDEAGLAERHRHTVSLRRLEHTLIATGRHTLVRLGREGVIGDDVRRKIEHELDLEEVRLKI